MGPVIEKLQHKLGPEKPMTPTLRSATVDLLTTLCPPSVAREKARELGVVRRQGKIDSYKLLMVVVLGLVVRGPTAIAQLGQILGEVTGMRLARSSFWDRFTPEFALLMRWLLDKVVHEARSEANRPPGVLSCFRDVIAADASVVKLRDELRPVWKGTRRNSAKAALKVHAWVRVFTGELLKYSITREAHADCKAFGIDHALHGTLMLFDRGYASPSLWRRIDSVGGYFLTRIPAGWNPRIVGENRKHRGKARSLAGLKLRDAIKGLKRSIVDVTATFRCRVRRYRGDKARKVDQTFRVIALRHPKTGELALYATNAPPQMLRAEDAWRIYRLRWEVELFFKTAKSGSGMNELPSRKKPIVETLVYAALLRATLSMRAKAKLLARLVARHRPRINHQQWMSWWNRRLTEFLYDLIGQPALMDVDTVIALLLDPNQGRIPTRFAFGGD